MSTSTPITASESSSTDVALGTFTAVVVTGDRLHVLRELTHQAVSHFGRDLLFVRGLSVASTDSGASWLATAEFSLTSYDA